MARAIAQDADTGATSLVEAVTEENFSSLVYRAAHPEGTIIEEGGKYVEVVPASGERLASRKMIFPVRTAS